MRTNLLISALPSAVLGLCSVPAMAQEFQATIATQYIDTETFNQVISDESVLQVEASYDLNKHLYVSVYAYTGFTKPFADDSSEYGFELGGKWKLARATATLAAGRYSYYQGQGFGQGDWYVKAGLTYMRVSVSASVLQGASDTVLLNVSYELPVTDKFTISPSVAYFTAQAKVNPAFVASYSLTTKLSIGAKFVLPMDSDTGKRNFYGAATLSYRF